MYVSHHPTFFYLLFLGTAVAYDYVTHVEESHALEREASGRVLAMRKNSKARVPPEIHHPVKETTAPTTMEAEKIVVKSKGSKSTSGNGKGKRTKKKIAVVSEPAATSAEEDLFVDGGMGNDKKRGKKQSNMKKKKKKRKNSKSIAYQRTSSKSPKALETKSAGKGKMVRGGPPPTFTVVNSCVTDGNCIRATNNAVYDSFAFCEWAVSGDATVVVRFFDVADPNDVVYVGDLEPFTGAGVNADGETLDGLSVSSGEVIAFLSDGQLESAGFEICLL